MKAASFPFKTRRGMSDGRAQTKAVGALHAIDNFNTRTEKRLSRQLLERGRSEKVETMNTPFTNWEKIAAFEAVTRIGRDNLPVMFRQLALLRASAAVQSCYDCIDNDLHVLKVRLSEHFRVKKQVLKNSSTSSLMRSWEQKIVCPRLRGKERIAYHDINIFENECLPGLSRKKGRLPKQFSLQSFPYIGCSKSKQNESRAKRFGAPAHQNVNRLFQMSSSKAKIEHAAVANGRISFKAPSGERFSICPSN
jgi:hypothetical protein